MWTVVYIAPSNGRAEKILKELAREGFLAKLRRVGTPEDEDGAVEVLVPELEVEEANEIINTMLSS